MNSNDQQPAAITPEQVQTLIDKQLALHPLRGRQTNTLSGVDLEYWAALALDYDRPVIISSHIPHVIYIGPSQNPDERITFNPLGNPSLMQELVEQQQIKLHPVSDFWVATTGISGRMTGVYGMSPEEAALRAIVMAHLGPEVNAELAYWNPRDREGMHFHANDWAAGDRLAIARWLKDRERMPPEELAQEAAWFANGVEPIPGRPGGWLINRPTGPEAEARIAAMVDAMDAEFRRADAGPYPGGR